MTCVECFTIGVLCGGVVVAAACVLAYALVHINQPMPAKAEEKDSVLE
jgi:hypothetical protein